jgi:hypothetical protein
MDILHQRLAIWIDLNSQLFARSTVSVCGTSRRFVALRSLVRRSYALQRERAGMTRFATAGIIEVAREVDANDPGRVKGRDHSGSDGPLKPRFQPA